MTDLQRLLSDSPYVGYAYSYPHKTVYRPLAPPRPLRQVWADEPKESLFLYMHVPFCEMRCGFCNLFTMARPAGDLAANYLAALQRQARRVRDAIGPSSIAAMAIGGGTPTWLDLAGLEKLFDLAENLFGAKLQTISVSVETSPRTAEPEKLRLLRARGVDRVSIGVQSFEEKEAAAAGRGQKTAEVERALGQIRDAGFPTLNIDLIYGLPGQTRTSWLASLRAALRFAPEELYLYPLYVRPLTGLDRPRAASDDIRLTCYRQGRDLLREAGYEQLSMRSFRLQNPKSKIQNPKWNYCCQEDGMIGLGCGARSYTRALHYAGEYAVGRRGVRDILADFIARPTESFDVADFGTELDDEEQRRRYVIKSLLRSEGLDLDAYRARFDAEAQEDLPSLAALERHGLTATTGRHLCLTDAGLERSDAIGPWLYSDAVRRRMEECELR